MNNYFSHDSNARNSDNLIPVRLRHGAAGYGVFFMILERLREEPRYMSVKDYNMIAFDLRVDASLVKSIIEDFGLFVFTDDGKYFYSESFMRRMEKKDEISNKRRESGKIGLKKRWEKPKMANATGNDSKCHENPLQNEDFAKENDSKERKGKERKEKESKVHSGEVGANEPPPETDLKKKFKAFQQWINEHAPNVAKMKEPFTIEQYERLRKDFTFEQITSMILKMHNWKDLNKKNVSANLTFRKWTQEDKKK